MAGGRVGPVTPVTARAAAEKQSCVRACISSSRLPDTPQLRSRHLMAKVEEIRACSWRAQPLSHPLAASHKWVLLLKVQELFPGFECRPPRPQRESASRRRDAAGPLALHLTRRPQSRAVRLRPAPFPAPGCFRCLLLAPGREVGAREDGDTERGLGGSVDSGAPGKCLNNRTDAAV